VRPRGRGGLPEWKDLKHVQVTSHLEMVWEEKEKKRKKDAEGAAA